MRMKSWTSNFRAAVKERGVGEDKEDGKRRRGIVREIRRGSFLSICSYPAPCGESHLGPPPMLRLRDEPSLKLDQK
jgi:hypothetical protein